MISTSLAGHTTQIVEFTFGWYFSPADESCSEVPELIIKRLVPDLRSGMHGSHRGVAEGPVLESGAKYASVPVISL
jgi:hypothetical protein